MRRQLRANWVRIFMVFGLVALAASAHAIESGKSAPEIGLTSLAGKPIKLSELRGKVVIVDFWASWCGPCREEMPVLESLHKRYAAKGLVVVGVSVDDKRKDADGFLDKVKVSFPIVHDADHKVAAAYEPPTMPSSYVIGPDGRIRHVHAGFREKDAAALESEVKALLP